MNNRLQQFLNAEDISQAQFADTIGVARASVSHILAGRNKPGFDFIEKMARNYPTLSLDWLINGKGRMYKGASERVDSPVKSSPQEPVEDIEHTGSLFVDDDISSDALSNPSVFRPTAPLPSEATTEQLFTGSAVRSSGQPGIRSARLSAHIPAGNTRISKIVVLFADGTFQELK